MFYKKEAKARTLTRSALHKKKNVTGSNGALRRCVQRCGGCGRRQSTERLLLLERGLIASVFCFFCGGKQQRDLTPPSRYIRREVKQKKEASRPPSKHTPSKSVLRLCAALRWGGCGQNEAEDKGTD